MGLDDSFIRVWGRGEPNDINRGESCVYLYTRKGYNFNDATCNANENFVCERPNSKFICHGTCCLMSLDMCQNLVPSFTIHSDMFEVGPSFITYMYHLIRTLKTF